MRNGQSVIVTADRWNFGLVPQWRWALSNGEIADEQGLVAYDGREHPHDLIRLEYQQAEADRGTTGMDSTTGKI